MGERVLSILFGCLATVLAIVSIVLAYIQYRTYMRQSTHNTTPAALELGHSTASTSSEDLELRSER
jgi:preprotein translocase subunit SecG